MAFAILPDSQQDWCSTSHLLVQVGSQASDGLLAVGTAGCMLMYYSYRRVQHAGLSCNLQPGLKPGVAAYSFPARVLQPVLNVPFRCCAG
jgi:hypothetical protein